MLSKHFLLPVGFALACFTAAPLTSAFAASDSTTNPGKHDTAKGAAAGALAGHEVRHGHALAGAAVGAAIGHHEKTKAQEKAAAGNKG
jgi:hypothetical protein